MSLVLIGLLAMISGHWSPIMAAAPGEAANSSLGVRLTQQTVTVGDITILEIDYP